MSTTQPNKATLKPVGENLAIHQLRRSSFSGDGIARSFCLPPIEVSDIKVYLRNSASLHEDVQQPGVDYMLSRSSAIVFANPPPEGDTVIVIYRILTEPRP